MGILDDFKKAFFGGIDHHDIKSPIKTVGASTNREIKPLLSNNKEDFRLLNYTFTKS